MPIDHDASKPADSSDAHAEVALIVMSHGTVCSRCLLWPDMCTCRADHPVRQIIAACFGQQS